MRKPRNIVPYGPLALLLNWEQKISEDINRSVHAYHQEITAWPMVVDCVPAYASLLVTFNKKPGQITLNRLFELKITAPELSSESNLIILPVAYGGQFGPDLAAVAAHLHLPEQQIIERHHTTCYYAYMLGFQPGFAFLGKLDETLRLPRRATPRTRVPPGSVAIAAAQTAVYPQDSPGGWHLIGRCPLPMRLNNNGLHYRIAAGDRVQFVPLSPEQFYQLQLNPEQWKP